MNETDHKTRERTGKARDTERSLRLERIGVEWRVEGPVSRADLDRQFEESFACWLDWVQQAAGGDPNPTSRLVHNGQRIGKWMGRNRELAKRGALAEARRARFEAVSGFQW